MLTSAELEQLESLYEGRPYHNMQHVRSMISLLQQSGQFTYLQYLACLYHDAIYDPISYTNEADSADLAVEYHPHLKNTILPMMIKSTANHYCSGNEEIDAFLDADLSILGSRAEQYVKYVTLARQEYSHLSDQNWKEGRRKWLTSMLDRPNIYHTSWFRDKFEQQAKQNLQRELESLC